MASDDLRMNDVENSAKGGISDDLMTLNGLYIF